jgi:hypothetical protein
MKASPLALLLLSLSCATPHWQNRVPTPGPAWLDLRPPMQLRVESAYYREGASRRGLEGYLGTEVARFQVQPKGSLRFISKQSMKNRPPDQPPVDRLLPSFIRRYRYYRFYFAIVFKRNAAARGSVLLGANQTAELERLSTELLIDPDAVCSDRSTHCTVFPEACSVAVEMNGEPVRLGPKPGERVPLN